MGFEVGQYDASQPLVIDPVLSYSTYLGGSLGDFAEAAGIAVDSSGNAYVTGYTASTNFPVTSGSFQTTFGGSGTLIAGDAFIAKLNPAGTALVYCTYLGGSDGDFGIGIAVDSSGSAYVTGATSSTNFPGTSSSLIQSTFSGDFQNAFVAKLNAAGTALVYSTYLGGNGGLNGGGDYGQGIGVDSLGNAYVTGFTTSTNFPGTSTSAIQSTLHGSNDVFVAKLNAAGAALVYSTYLGGSSQEGPGNIAVDSSGNAYVTGYTYSTDFPGVSSGSIQPTFGGRSDAFVAKLNPAGSALVYSTYLGGSGYDLGYSIAVDSSGNAYVTGDTESTNFPGAGSSPIQSSLSGSDDAFVAKLNATGTALVYSTYLGGSGADGGFGIAVDSSGNAYLTGITRSTDFPGASLSAIQPTFGGGFGDAFVAKLNPAGSALLYSTYLGGSSSDDGRGIAVDSSGSAYVFGTTFSTDFPGASSSSIQSTYGGGGDAFIAKIGVSPSPAAAVTILTNLLSDPSLQLTSGQISSLTDKLNNALASIQAGLNKQAINQLNAFINSVQSSMKTGKMSMQAGNTLINDADAIIAAL